MCNKIILKSDKMGIQIHNEFHSVGVARLSVITKVLVGLSCLVYEMKASKLDWAGHAGTDLFHNDLLVNSK